MSYLFDAERRGEGRVDELSRTKNECEMNGFLLAYKSATAPAETYFPSDEQV